MTPRKGEVERDKLLQVRIAESERERFKAAAQACGINMTSWIRERLLACASKEGF